jgi:pilus assembly protein FimV
LASQVEEVEEVEEAAVEAIEVQEEPAEIAAKVEDAPTARRSRAELQPIDDVQGDNMERLMAETDQQMGEPESATRRDAFAHLRAAVAAKKADQAMGSDQSDEASDDAYRSDLADVVRPRRPVAGRTRTARPGESRPAPLKLVAEQRIDVDAPASPAAPVRPRRVAAALDTAELLEGEESFADFAAEMGASTLPELLEAAAAYMSFVEGREQFSRPQLMTKVRQAGPDDGFSREDTLRSFGKLLRDGKIEKLKGGRFIASQDIGFRPDQRAAS